MTETSETLITTDEILNAAGGKAGGSFEKHASITGASIDSRTCARGNIFIPLPGTRTDGHFFIEEAVRNGAVASFVKKEVWQQEQEQLIKLKQKYRVCFIVVDDVLTSFQKSAGYYISRFPALHKIGITGSSGKTTTKELIGAVLSRQYATFCSTGNLNSDIGVSLSAFQVKESHEYAVFEMGINRIGEMEELVDIVRPDSAVITTTGTAHIGLFGSEEIIAREKKKIFSGFTAAGAGYVREDDGFRDFLTRGVEGEVHFFGPESIENFTIVKRDGLKGTLLNWQGHNFRLPLIGDYNVYNACAAVKIAEHLEIPCREVIEALESIEPLFGRGQIKIGDIILVCDYYNANPESMSNALDFMKALETPGHKIAVLGAMKELGDFTEKAHEELGKKLKSSSLHRVYLFGEEMRVTFETAGEHMGRNVFWTKDANELVRMVRQGVNTGDVVLLKGSRAAALERIEKSIAG